MIALNDITKGVALLVGGVVVGLVLASSFNCSPGKEVAKPGKTEFVDRFIRVPTQVHDTTEGAFQVETVEPDTLSEQEEVFELERLLAKHPDYCAATIKSDPSDGTHGTDGTDKPGSIASAIKSLIPELAGPVIAAFRPQTPRNFFEVYAKAGHDLLGGYGGAAMLYLNLDQIHVANVTVYLEAGFLHGFYAMVGVLGKLWGLW